MAKAVHWQQHWSQRYPVAFYLERQKINRFNQLSFHLGHVLPSNFLMKRNWSVVLQQVWSPLGPERGTNEPNAHFLIESILKPGKHLFRRKRLKCCWSRGGREMGFLLFFFCWVPTLSLGKCTRLQNKQTAARLLFKYFLFAEEHNLKKKLVGLTLKSISRMPGCFPEGLIVRA